MHIRTYTYKTICIHRSKAAQKGREKRRVLIARYSVKKCHIVYIVILVYVSIVLAILQGRQESDFPLTFFDFDADFFLFPPLRFKRPS